MNNQLIQKTVIIIPSFALGPFSSLSNTLRMVEENNKNVKLDSERGVPGNFFMITDGLFVNVFSGCNQIF
jgi:hypothetical protein